MLNNFAAKESNFKGRHAFMLMTFLWICLFTIHLCTVEVTAEMGVRVLAMRQKQIYHSTKIRRPYVDDISMDLFVYYLNLWTVFSSQYTNKIMEILN